MIPIFVIVNYFSRDARTEFFLSRVKFELNSIKILEFQVEFEFKYENTLYYAYFVRHQTIHFTRCALYSRFSKIRHFCYQLGLR
jgi:hypothetical protein